MSEAPAAPQPSQDQPQVDSLHPAQINYKQIKDKELRDIADKKIEAWYQELEKDLSAVMQKHGVGVYGMGFQHPGSKEYMLLSGGNLYDVAKSTTAIALYMRRRVLEELKIDDR